MLKRILFFVIAFKLILFFNLFGTTKEIITNPDLKKIIVAKIDDEPITYEEFEKFLELFKKKPKTLDEKLKMLNNLIARKLIIEDAKKKGYFNRKDIKENLKKHKFLKKSGEITLVLKLYFYENISKKVKITEEEINKFIKKHKGINKHTAKEIIAVEKEKKLFDELIKRLKKGRKIIIFKDNL